MSIPVFSTVISFLSTWGNVHIRNRASSAARDINFNSLSEYSKELQLLPTFAIESEILNDPNMQVLIETALTTYSAFYLTAISIDSTINGISVGTIISKYNPKRDLKPELINFGEEVAVSLLSNNQTPGLSTQAFIPKKSNINLSTCSLSTSLRDYKLDESFKDLPNKFKGNINVSTEDGSRQDYKLIREEVNALSNLATGKLLKVSITRENKSAEVNILLKPQLSSISSKLLVNIANVSNRPFTMRERWKAYWQRGNIYSAWDWLTCRDLVEAHRRNLVKDTSGYYEKVYNAKVQNGLVGFLTGRFSVGTIANSWIISEETLRGIEVSIGGSINNKRLRDKFMADTSCMTLFVYNVDYGRVFIYNHGMEDYSEVSISSLAKKVKKDNFDLDVFKLISQNSAPII